MSFTNKTPNYNLPQWLGTDKPSWLVDVNGAFSNIDTAIKAAADSGSGADATAKAALETAQTAQDTANTANETANGAVTTAGESKTIANNAQLVADEAITKVNALGPVTNWKSYIALNTSADVEINSALTKNTGGGDFNQFQRLILFYNPSLKLMQISFYTDVTYTGSSVALASAFTDSRYPGAKLVPLYKLPFTCTGTLSVPYFMYKGNVGDTIAAMNTAVIINIGDNAWVCGVTADETITWKYPAIGGMPQWLNVANLGTITLKGWNDVV